MRLLGPVHVVLLIGIAAIAVWLAILCRRRLVPIHPLRLALGYGLAVNEIIWWIFRYSHEGFRFPNNLPLQLCDLVVWSTALACITLAPWLVEFSYFAGIAGAGMALLTPDLWSPWPSYPAIYFFLAHGGVVIAIITLVFGGIAPVRRGAMWRTFGMLLMYVAFLAGFDAIFRTNYMYLCRKPKNETLLNVLGPWPLYLGPGFAIALALFWLLSLVVPSRAVQDSSERL